MISIALALSIIITTGSFALEYSRAGYENLAVWTVIFGLIWLASLWFKWRWVSTLAVILALPLAVFGVWFQFVIGWMFSGAIFSLLAWDLMKFQHMLLFVNVREDILGMTRRHIARISLLALIGMLIASFLMYLRGQFNAEWGLFLASVLGLGSLQIVAWLWK